MLDAELLAEVDLFSTLPPEVTARVAAEAETRELRRGDVLFRVTAGRIAIANKSFDGRESVVALMEAGDVFGEMSLFDGQGRSAEARALESSVVQAIPFEPLRTVLDEQPELLWHVLALLAR